MATPLHSFDVFDTVLSRVHAEPDDVHHEYAEAAAARGWTDDVAALVAARRAAETQAWQDAGHHRAITVEAIHEALAEALGWPEGRAAESLALELAIEAAAVRALRGPKARLDALRLAGRRICFISDMHLSGAQVRGMLEGLQLALPLEPVYVSSDIGLSKRSGGRLFGHVMRQHRLWPWPWPQQLRHVGDDRRADVRMARLRGAVAHHRPAARLDRHDRASLAALDTLDASGRADWRSRTLVSAARFARLDLAPPGTDARRWQLLCSSVAPLVTGYALWLLEQARLQGLDALFFMARDMQVVHAVAEAIVQARGLPIRCVYLHASRTAWQPAGYRADPDFDLFWLGDQPQDADPREALGRLLDPAGIETLAARGLLTVAPGEARADTVRRWLADPAVAEVVDQAVAQRRGRLLATLDGLGFRADGRCALVDAGWRGTLQKCLSRALQAAGDPAPQIPAFYIGLRHRVALEPGSTMTAFLADAEVARLGYSLVALVESFLSADHGSTLDYRLDESGKPQPVLGPVPPEALQAQAAQVRAACLAHVREFLPLPCAEGDPLVLSRALAAPFVALCATPSADDVAALRGWQIDTGRAVPVLRPLVRSLTLKDGAKLLLAAWHRRAEGDVYLSSPWLRGALAAASWPLRTLARRALRS